MCLQPITLKPTYCKYDGQFHSYTVPCGKCLECKIKYQNDWFVRLSQESKQHGVIIFFTLTYRERISPRYWMFNKDRRQFFCPYYVDKNTGETHRTVYLKHVQDWLKRFRINRYRRLVENGLSNEVAKVKNRFKYFITSEYGPQTLRPHYHGIFFGVSESDFRDAYEDWMDYYGNVEYSVIYLNDAKYRSNIFRYVAKYCSKGVFENPKVELGLVDKTFHLISKKLGANYITPQSLAYHLGRDIYIGKQRINNHQYTDDYLNYLIINRRIFVDGWSYDMPRYYRNQIYGEQSNLSYQMSAYLRAQHDKLHFDKLEQLQAQGMSEVQALNKIIITNLEEINYRRVSCHQRLAAFYKKSKI